MARFYGAVLGWKVVARDEPSDRLGGSGWILMESGPGDPTVSFQAETWYRPPVWPEVDDAPTKMMHFEVAVPDLAAAVEHVVRAGGREAVRQPADRDPAKLRVMLDPAGHPFCLVEE